MILKKFTESHTVTYTADSACEQGNKAISSERNCLQCSVLVAGVLFCVRVGIMYFCMELHISNSISSEIDPFISIVHLTCGPIRESAL